jgi:hypothetical protein
LVIGDFMMSELVRPLTKWTVDRTIRSN